jgi:hypothetical protein
MRQCDLSTSASRIGRAWKKLEEAWQDASDEWNDAVSRRFLEHQLEPMIPDLKLGLDAIGRMDVLMNEVRRDCES